MTPVAQVESVLPDLRKILAQSGLPLVPSSAQAFDLVFDDELAVTVRLHPDGRTVAADLWCGDAQGVEEADRRILVELLLALNARDPGDVSRWVGLDSRDFILLHGTVHWDGLDADSLARWLQSLVDEADGVRSLVRLLLP